MQLTTVGQEVWRGAKQAQRLNEAGAGDPTVQERLRKLKLAQSLHDREADWAEIQELVGISRATYYRWAKELRQKGLGGLKPKRKRPKRFRGKILWTPELLNRIETLRKANPTWGRWPIRLALCDALPSPRSGEEGFKISERTVGRMLVYLERHGRVERVASFLARTRCASFAERSEG